MSNGGGVIIVCGTGGSPVTDKVITIYDAPLSVAIKIDKTALIADLEHRPDWNHQKATLAINKLALRIERDYWGWGEELEDLSIPYERHEPHAQP